MGPKEVSVLSCLVVSLLFVAGCSNAVGNKATLAGGTNNSTKSHSTDNSNHVDGTILSLTPIQVSNTEGLNTYRMIYWSDNVKTEAFLAVPLESGIYPLLVSCHGGYDRTMDSTHVASPEDQSSLENANPNFITLIPEYRGYDASDGTVQGLSGDTLDTSNAIKAVMGKYSVEPGHLYLDGASMGGGVVLQLASNRHDVRSVIALSPFVGWDIVGQWAMLNKDKNDRAFNLYGHMLTYGTNNPNSPVLNKESVDFKTITAPVLLLQGTGDQSVPWETVQTFYKDLKPYDKQTKLILFPGGQHGLHDKYQEQVNQDINDWFQLYGEHGSFYN